MNDHKHLGLVLDSKLSFTKHINEKITTARKGIGVIKPNILRRTNLLNLGTKFTKCMYDRTSIIVI